MRFATSATNGVGRAPRRPTALLAALSRFAAYSDEILVPRGNEVSTLVAYGVEAPRSIGSWSRSPVAPRNGQRTASRNLRSPGLLHQRHRAVEFLKFLKTIDGNVPAHLDVHLVLDNASSHKTPKIQRWLATHPRFHLHFTPTSGFWLNLVERWISELTTKLLKRAAHRSVRALNADIRQSIETWNENPRPYVWVKTAEQILESIRRYCQRINQTGTLGWISQNLLDHLVCVVLE